MIDEREVRITEITRRNIFDEIYVKGIIYYGRSDEVGFLKRIFNLEKKSSHDSRFKNMEQDIRQHRYNNHDWEDDWIQHDSRIGLFKCDDQTFLKFLCEMIHPAVRNNEYEVNILLDIFNTHLKNDGFKIVIQGHISNRPVFHGIISDEFFVPFENTKKVGRDFAKEQLEKCERKLSEGDFDGAISSARSFLEDVMRDVYKKITGKEIPGKGDLIKYFKEIKKMLDLEKDKTNNASLNQLIGNLTAVVNVIAHLSNKMGDRHSREIEPERHHAKLVINSAKTIADFLYDTSNRIEDDITSTKPFFGLV